MKPPTSAHVISYNEVDNTNFATYFFQIIKKLNVASHIALDLEFTALANVKTADMNHRYAGMKKTVESAAIAEIGLSVFKHIDTAPKVLPPAMNRSLSDLTNFFDPEEEEEEGEREDQQKKEEEEHWIPSSQPLPNTNRSSLFSPLSSQQTDSETTNTAATATAVTLKQEDDDQTSFAQKYECDNFNLLTLKQGDFTIDTSTGQFLVKHGYSFDKLYQYGIPFTPPSDDPLTKDPSCDTVKTVDRRLRQLWKHMMGVMRFHHVPLVLHNGLYDLMYIYHSFIGPLPETLSTFILKVSDAFPSGIFDTRYLADQAEFSATFLPYVFAKSDRIRQNRFSETSTVQKPYFEVDVKPSMIPSLLTSGIKRKRMVEVEQGKTVVVAKAATGKKKVEAFCVKYSERGYCDNKEHDPVSPLHDIQLILDIQMGPSPYTQVYTSRSNHTVYGAHAAHFDAYMTAFSYCFFRNTLSASTLKSSLNKMMISGLTHPLCFPIKRQHPIITAATAISHNNNAAVAIRSTQ